ncbi:uncharacterized protein OCT59_002489 [Rhizophagus irregularis]|uniref:uncharacterized protein n=1 Tax=Rhizophagus irregularis TaxID=588596 RepID=UPI0019F0B1C8|nr:hypothetical protein OCT59_002489 [Rhizophagus irregularis]GBC17963.2 hypothetical protein RIR_jg26724.t1 [Rhizophagus irregularis DAOM 181602=DAOM 197198]
MPSIPSQSPSPPNAIHVALHDGIYEKNNNKENITIIKFRIFIRKESEDQNICPFCDEILPNPMPYKTKLVLDQLNKIKE